MKFEEWKGLTRREKNKYFDFLTDPDLESHKQRMDGFIDEKKILQGAVSFCHDTYYSQFVRAWQYCRDNKTLMSVPDRDGDDCWIPPVKTVKKGSSGIQWSVTNPNKTGHVQINIRSAEKGAQKRTRTCLKTGKVYTTFEYKHYKVYLHHLSLFARGVPTLSHQDVVGSDGKVKSVRWTASHLCSTPNCFRPSHILREPHAINVSRQLCHTEMCPHTPKCKRTLQRVLDIISGVINDNKSPSTSNDLPLDELSQTFY